MEWPEYNFTWRNWFPSYYTSEQSSRWCFTKKKMLFKADNRPAGNGFRYGLVQCTRDINHTECHNCLKNLVAKVFDCCQMKIAFLIVNPSCNLRYGDNSFIEQPPALLQSPPQSGNAKILDFYFTWQFPLHIFALLNYAIS